MRARNCKIVSLFFLFLAVSSTYACKKKKHYKPCKQFVMYFHENLYDGTNAENATSAIVAAPAGANLTTLAPQFHFCNIIIVFDDPVTLDDNFHSPPVGRAQGLYLYDEKTSFTEWVAFSFVLNSTDYQGTINFVGADPTLVDVRYISIVGGNGDFFMHIGIATVSSDAFVPPAFFRVKMDIKFYDCW